MPTGRRLEYVSALGSSDWNPAPINTLAFSPDGRHLAGAGSGSAHLWDTDTRSALLHTPGSAIQWLDADRLLLLSVNRRKGGEIDAKLAIVPVDGDPTTIYEGPPLRLLTKEASDLVVLHGVGLARASTGGLETLFDLGLEGRVEWASTSEDGQQAAFIHRSGKGRRLYTCDVATGEVRLERRSPPGEHLAYARENLLTVSRTSVSWLEPDGRRSREVQLDQAGLLVAPYGDEVVVLGIGVLWIIGQDAQAIPLPGKHPNALCCRSEDGVVAFSDKRLGVHLVSPGTASIVVPKAAGHTGPVNAVSTCEAGVLSGSNDRRLITWTPESIEQTLSLDHPITAICRSAAGTHIGQKDGALLEYDFDWSLVSEHQRHRTRITGICMVGENSIASAGMDGRIVISERGNEEPAKDLQGDYTGYLNLAFTSEGLLIGGREGGWDIWTLGGELRERIPAKGMWGACSLATLDGWTILSDSSNFIRGFKGTQTWERELETSEIRSLAAADGGVLLAGTVKGSVYLLDIETGETLDKIWLKQGSINSLSASDGHVYAATEHGSVCELRMI